VRRELLRLTLGSHDPALQGYLNRFAPVRVFNLSITPPELIEATHARMRTAYHRSGGPWRRDYLPRTTFVFLNASRAAAKEEAERVLTAYWQALDGTVDPAKVADATDNALVGNPADVAGQILTRFHPDDRLMLWFDFFNHDNDRVVDSMAVMVAEVLPRLADAGIAVPAAVTSRR
jgi:hypothetical protein